ncbi:MAG: hypothetical protein QM619_08005 [Micropruina sp.]|uniref:hypothetical protein n=1 Tax=Micropruina sp. TaxID=2737536 RepID=UPI0039E224B2
MDTSNRGGRWLVSGAIGLAVLGTAGCARSGPTSQQAGPAVVLSAPTQAVPSKQPSAKASPLKSTSTETSTATVDGDRTTKQVPLAKPKSLNETSNSAPSPRTPKSPPSARTP